MEKQKTKSPFFFFFESMAIIAFNFLINQQIKQNDIVGPCINIYIYRYINYNVVDNIYKSEKKKRIKE